MRVGDAVIGGPRLAVIGGVNVLEPSLDNALRVGEVLAETCARLGLPLVFKASWDKANRTSIASYRGPGLDAGLAMLGALRARLGVPILTDVHEPAQAAPVAEVVDMLQVPAFLVRQTDLIAACAATGRPLHLKRMPMLPPEQMGFVVEKCRAFGQDQVVLCERGTAYGAGPLVVDPLGLRALAAHGAPVSLDVTHALQVIGQGRVAAGGRSALAEPLALAGVAAGVDAIFIEAHPDPAHALCDGPSATPLAELPALLARMAAVAAVVRR